MMTLNKGIWSKNAVAAAVVLDTFNRADSTTVLGSADTGQIWTIGPSARWGILSNQVYQPALTFNSYAFIDSGISDCRLSVDIPVQGAGNVMIYFRIGANTSASCFHITTTATQYILTRVVGYGATPLATVSLTPANGDNLSIHMNGSAIAVYVNGTLIASVTDSNNVSSTKHGMHIEYSTTVRYDNFKVEAL